jgi:hypothetical protein
MHGPNLFMTAALLALSWTASAQPPAPALAQNPLQSLRRDHPRLMGSNDRILDVHSLIKSDALAKKIYDQLVAEAAKIETSPPVEHKLVGPRLLDQSRRALDRVYTLALLYRLTSEKRYRDRAVKEMRAAADMPDWNPSHFLDTAEMTHALAIGYDWLFPVLTSEERAWIRAAIVEKGLKPSLPIYKENRWWARAHHNWNQVCNGGMAIGALAIAEDEPELARSILSSAIQSIPLAMNSYAPDGGWNEGPGYWHYATRYNVYFLAAFETALGTDFGLAMMPGFDRAGHFRVYFNGPTNRTFNYADAGDGSGPAEEMFWLARRFKEPVYAFDEQAQLTRTGRGHALDLLWFVQEAKSPSGAGWPLNSFFKGVNTVFLRSSWDAPDAIFVGVKGGDNKANHSHLDLGTFVLDVGNVRFASDLGPDNYNLPAYFGVKRWEYYRLNSQSHNTVLIDGENQHSKAEAPVTKFDAAAATAEIDLTAAYPGKLKNWTRSVQLKAGKQVVVHDRIAATKPVDAVWGMVTEADVSLVRRVATLTKGGRKLEIRLVSPTNASFDVISTQPPAPQRQNEGTRKLIVRLPEKVTTVDLAVTMTPIP